MSISMHGHANVLQQNLTHTAPAAVPCLERLVLICLAEANSIAEDPCAGI